MRKTSLSALSRRQMLAILASATGVALAGLPRGAVAGPAEAEAMLKDLTGNAPLKDGRINLTLPQVAENGASVPITIAVDSPMSDSDYVKSIHIVADGNPSPAIASFHFTPAAGKAEVSTRVRLAKTQKIRAVAVMADGSCFQAAKEVKVTVGGCGG